MKSDNVEFDYEISHIIFKDSKGKEYLVAKETIELWKSTFGIQRVDDKFVPSISQKLYEILEKDNIITLFVGISSLLTITAKQYQNAIPQVKKVLESPEIIIDNGKCKSKCENGKDYTLAKCLDDKAYFLNMRLFGSGATRNCRVSISSSRKKQREFKKAIENGASYAVLNKENLIQKKLGLKLHEKIHIRNEDKTTTQFLLEK